MCHSLSIEGLHNQLLEARKAYIKGQVEFMEAVNRIAKELGIQDAQWQAMIAENEKMIAENEKWLSEE